MCSYTFTRKNLKIQNVRNTVASILQERVSKGISLICITIRTDNFHRRLGKYNSTTFNEVIETNSSTKIEKYNF